MGQIFSVQPPGSGEPKEYAFQYTVSQVRDCRFYTLRKGWNEGNCVSLQATQRNRDNDCVGVKNFFGCRLDHNGALIGRCGLDMIYQRVELDDFLLQSASSHLLHNWIVCRINKNSVSLM